MLTRGDKNGQSPPKYVDVDGCKIESRKYRNRDEYYWFISYRSISDKFWDDIYTAFDKQYPGKHGLDIFLQEWDSWYAYLSNKHEKDEEYFNSLASPLHYPDHKYCVPWDRGISIDYVRSSFTPEEQGLFIESIRPPTRQSNVRRIVNRDFIARERREECKYANAYSILLLGKSYYGWLDENVENNIPIEEVYANISIDQIAEKVSNIEHHEYIFCGAIPYFLLNEKYIQTLRKNISDGTQQGEKLYTYILLYPSFHNLESLSKLRRIPLKRIYYDVLRTYQQLIYELVLLSHKNSYIRVLFADSLPSYDVHILDNKFCLVSLDIGYVANPNYARAWSGYEKESSNVRTLLFIRRANRKLFERFESHVEDLWTATLKKYYLERFLCKYSFFDELRGLITESLKGLNSKEEQQQLEKKDKSMNDPMLMSIFDYQINIRRALDELLGDAQDEPSFLPSRKHKFSRCYSMLFVLCQWDKEIAFSNELSFDTERCLLDGYRIIIRKELEKLYQEMNMTH